LAKQSTDGTDDGAAPLETYRKKRDPTRTQEPFGPEPTRRAGGPTRQGEFVVHLHDATRLHYDLRLEVGGVLRSFAIPKGPSLDPAEKRMAVETEDHPLMYLDFEDVIPAGSYGAGAMIAWDVGRVVYPEQSIEDGHRDGKIDFLLDGHKLRGRFALVRTSGRKPDEGLPRAKQAQWLLLKKTDVHARPGSDIIAESPRSVLSGLTVEELPAARERAAALLERARALGGRDGRIDVRRISPMLCSLEKCELVRPGFCYELKLDGVRILAHKRGDDVRLFYRTRRPATAAFPEIARAVRTLACEEILLDGEIVTYDESGRPSFQRLARRLHAQRPGDVRWASRSVPVQYLVFDVVAVGDVDLTGLPLSARKELLAQAVPGKGFVRMLDHLEGDGRPLYDLCKRLHLEGVVAKDLASPYVPGPKRTGSWVKVKCERDDDFVVVAWTLGGRSGELGALALASHDEEGKLVVRGRVGSGLDDKMIAKLLERLEPMRVDRCAASGPLEKGHEYVFVRPELVVTVRYLGWSDGGTLRFPVFHSLRDDVDIASCTAGPPAADDAVLALAGKTTRHKPDTKLGGRRRIQLTNQSKVFWPDEGFTKGDLCEYYEAVSEVIIPHLADRPVVLVRYPDGIYGKNFYQWRLPPGAPSWLRCVPHRTEEDDGKEKNTFLISDLDSLLYVANLGCIPLHVIAARAETLEQCDFLTIDFDVGEARLRDAIELARELRSVLDDIGLPGYPKTSGQTGLHVLVPLGPGVPFDGAKALCELLGRIVTQRHPDIATMERVKPKRGKRVLVDVGQTGRSRTIVAPYSVRAYRGARVSTPLGWDEVGLALDPGAYTIATVPARVEAAGDPMAALVSARPDVPSAVAALGKLVGL
jgi:bifunctional non-homologous end joining protein LigD